MASEPAATKLAPTPMERAPVPDLGTALMPKERYTSRAYKALEDERRWPTVWHLAGFVSDLAEPGSYFTYEVGKESVLVIRQESGAVVAFHNVCMHRGNRLVEPGRGRAGSFTCLFHAWRFGIDGTLEHALDDER